MQKKKKMMGGCLAAALILTAVVSPAQALAAQPSVKLHVEAVAQSLRLAGADRYETAAKISKEGWSQSEYAVLAAGTDANLVDSITAAPLAKQVNAPILLTEGSGLNAYTEAELIRLGVKKVYVTTGTGVISQNVFDRLSALGIEAIKLGGSDRFETSINIAKQLKPFNKVVVTTAWTNADALSIAAIAAQKGTPILLTENNQLPANVASYINSVKSEVSGTYVLGGTEAVSDTVKNALPDSVRLGGADRFATNIEILDYFAKTLNYGKAYVANGEDGHLVDALTVSPLAAQTGAPVVLTGGALPAGTEEYFKANLTPNIVALGGETVVSNAVVGDLANCLVYDEAGVVKGGSSEAAPEQISETVVLKGDDLTLQNANLAYSVLVQGDNATLKNLNVEGTVFINEGSTGTVTLDNVTAANIVVISGTQYGTYAAQASGTSVSVNLNNSKADALIVQGDGQTDLNSKGNSIEGVYIGGQSNVVLNGEFDTVTVVGSGTITAGPSARIGSLVIDSDNRNDVITLNGNFDRVVLGANVRLVLGPNTVVKNLVLNSDARVELDKSAQVSNVANNGHSIDYQGDGTVGEGGGSSGGTTALKITDISNAEIRKIDGSDYIVLSSDPENIKNAFIKVSKDSTMKLQVNTGTVADPDWITLAEWQLEKNEENGIFSISNMEDIDFANTLTALRESGLDIEDIMDAINFNALLGALQESGDDEVIYGADGIIMTLIDAINDPDLQNRQAVYESLNLYGIYNEATPGVQEAIRTGLEPAAANFSDSDEAAEMLLDDLLGTDEEARQEALRDIKNSDPEKNVQFFEDINFETIFEALADADATSKQAMLDAVNFNAVFTTVRDGYTSELDFYLYVATVFNKIFELSPDTKASIQDAVDYGQLVAGILDGYSEKGVRINLTNNSSSKAYYVTIED